MISQNRILAARAKRPLSREPKTPDGVARCDRTTPYQTNPVPFPDTPHSRNQNFSPTNGLDL